jgi:ketosteroid isomerase-like protein
MSENVDAVRLIYAAWERGDYSSAEWAHPDIEYVNADGPDRGTRVGLAGMAESWRRLLSVWSEFQTNAEEYRELDDGRVLVLAAFGGTARITGLDVRDGLSRGANIFELRDGRVSRLTLYWNQERAFAELGIGE